MDAFTTFLASLGPWGIVAGAALTIGIQYLRNRVSPPAPAPGPNPAPSPAPAPAPAPSGTPILDALLNLLKLRLLKPAPAPNAAGAVPADISHDDAAELLGKLFPKK